MQKKLVRRVMYVFIFIPIFRITQFTKAIAFLLATLLATAKNAFSVSINCLFGTETLRAPIP